MVAASTAARRRDVGGYGGDMGEIWARYREDIGEHGGSQALSYTPLHPPISHPYLPHISAPYLPCISPACPIVSPPISPLYLAGARGARGGGGDARRLEAGARVSLSLSLLPLAFLVTRQVARPCPARFSPHLFHPYPLSQLPPSLRP